MPDDDPDATPPTWPRNLLIATLVPLCWLSMQIVHEAGHVVSAWATGGRVTTLALPPLGISRTDVDPNPSPLAVVWSGPLVGVLLPLAAWGLVRLLRPSVAYPFRFFAGFCLVANGAYIGCGVTNPVGDAATIRQLHPAVWPLALFGVVTVVPGLLLWNGQAALFGIGRGARPVRPLHAAVVAAILAIVVLAELAWGVR